MPPAIYIGIDPGASGGLAFIYNDQVTAFSMPKTERDIWDAVYDELAATDADTRRFAVIERVGGFIAGNPSPGSAMFKFGHSYGGLRMALVGNDVPFDDVTPQKWQKALGITPRNKEESKPQFKNRLKARAQLLFPKLRVTLDTADALLLAEFCRRMRTGSLGEKPEAKRNLFR